MTYEERLEQHERETARIAEKQTRLNKYIAGITIAAVACFGYAALTIFNPALPTTVTFLLFCLFGFCSIRGVALRDEIISAKQRQIRDMIIVAPNGRDTNGLVRGRYGISTEHP
tara:strand:+ start:3208 stop:3549 length:342 start_codon:yes stop_codon:yes gene_type:complete